MWLHMAEHQPKGDSYVSDQTCTTAMLSSLYLPSPRFHPAPEAEHSICILPPFEALELDPVQGHMVLKVGRNVVIWRKVPVQRKYIR